MSIEIGYIPEGEDEKRIIGRVAVGEFASMPDYSAEVSQIVSIFCLPDDSGGEVYAFDNEYPPETDEIQATSAEPFTPDTREAAIPFEGSYERNITNRSRRRGRLVLTHVLNH